MTVLRRGYLADERASGAVMHVCLLLLIPLLVLGATSMESAVLGERMAANFEDRGRAFSAAEAALERAEAWLRSQEYLPIATNTGEGRVWMHGVLDAKFSVTAPWWRDPDANLSWWAAHGTAVVSDASAAVPARYIIEQYRFVTEQESIGVRTGQVQPVLAVHRITALGVGRRATTRIRLQSTFLRPYEK